MKTIFVLLTLIANLAFARNDQDNHTEISYTVVQLASVDATIASVRLNDSGVITVTKHDRTFKTLKLSNINKQDMLWLAQIIVEADLETETRTFLCEILLPVFSIQNLRIYDSSDRTMKLVLSSSSCALPNYTRPKEEHLAEAARTLKAKLIVLAQQLY